MFKKKNIKKTNIIHHEKGEDEDNRDDYGETLEPELKKKIKPSEFSYTVRFDRII